MSQVPGRLAATPRRIVVALVLLVTVGVGAGSALGDGGDYSCGYTGFCTNERGAPEIQTDEGRATGPTSATIAGRVVPANLSTTYAAEYDVATSAWCSSDGKSGTPAHTTAPKTLNQADGYSHSALVAVPDLATGGDYCGQLIAQNSAGSDEGAPPVAFSTGVAASTGRIYLTGPTTATVSGTVNPAGATTTYGVDYGTASSTWCTSGGTTGTAGSHTSVKTLPSTVAKDTNVSAKLSGLSSGTRYCGRLVAKNDAGTSRPTTPVRFVAGIDATTDYASASGPTSGRVSGSVNLVGQSGSYAVAYDGADSPWCKSNGETGTAAHTTPATGAKGRASFETTLSGLTQGTAYCAAAIATSGSGTAVGRPPLTFTPGLPTTGTTSLDLSGPGVVTAGAEIDPKGLPTTYVVQYDESTSTWCTSDGRTGTPAHTTPSTPVSDASSSSYPRVDVGGLTAGTSYCFAFSAYNAAGTSTPAGLNAIEVKSALVYLGRATRTSETAASITGDVNPLGRSTTAAAQYDVTTSQWCTSRGASGTPSFVTPSVSISPTDTDYHDVSFVLSGLTSGQEYCASIAATNAAGTTTSGTPTAVRSTTPSQIQLRSAGHAITGPGTARVFGSMYRDGRTVTYKAEYGPAESTWCTSSGSEGSPAASTASKTISGTPTDFPNYPDSVNVDIAGLTPGATYCALVAATSDVGTIEAYNPETFVAGQPTANISFFDDPQVTSPTSVTINGNVNAAGQTTKYHVDYDSTDSAWCQSYGTSDTATHHSTEQTLAATDADDHAVAVGLTGLTPGISYCAALVATNASATSDLDYYFAQFVSGLPEARTQQVHVVSASAADVGGTVNPGGQTTTYAVQYDAASSDWCDSDGSSGTAANETAAQTLPQTDTVDHDVTISLAGLTPGSRYCAGLVAHNSAGDNERVSIYDFTAGAPTVGGTDANPTGATTATVTGTIDPAGQTTTYRAVYDAESSAWCSSGGDNYTPAFTTPVVTLPATDASPHAVSVSLSGLTTGAGYCAALVATNGSASTTSSASYFTPGSGSIAPPSATAAPTITGVPRPGELLVEHHGTWNGSPTGYSYQWRSCDENGGGCFDIPGATDGVYTVQTADLGRTIVVTEAARNAGGTGSPAASEPTAVVAAASPGGGDTGGGGTGGGEAPVGGGGPAGGASPPNGGAPPTAGGGAPGTTTTPMSPAPPPAPTQKPTVSDAPQLRGSITTTIAGVVSLSQRCADPQGCQGTVRLTATQTSKSTRASSKAKKHKTVAIGQSTYSIANGKTKTLTIKLNATGRKLLKRGKGKLKATLQTTPKGAKAPTASKKLTLKAAKTKRR
jgi:hypothetical protein